MNINITLLQQRILQELQNRDVSCHPVEPSVIGIVYADQEVLVSLHNLHRSVLMEPSGLEECIQDFLDRILLTQKRSIGAVYPRILATEHNKALSHPWVESFLGLQLEVALIEHVHGRMHFLTPLKVMNRTGGLKRAKYEAIQNIQKLLPQVEPVRLSPTVYRVCHPDVLTSSLVLYVDELAVCKVEHQTVQFAIPSRGTLYFSTDNLQLVAHLIEREYQTDPYPIRRDIFQTTVGHIQRFRQSWDGQ